MNETTSTSSSLGRRALAFVVLLIAAWLLLKLVIGVVSAVAWTLVTIVAVVGVLWALKVLIW